VHDLARELGLAFDRRYERDAVGAGADNDDARANRIAAAGRRPPPAFDRDDRRRLDAEARRDPGARGVGVEVVDDALARHVARSTAGNGIPGSADSSLTVCRCSRS
jgi:hypothetical protein